MLDKELLQKYDLYQIEGPQWIKAKKGYFYDENNNKWLDFTSGIINASAGHKNKYIINAIIKPLKEGIAQAWYRPSEYRLKAHLELQKVLPKGFTKTIFLVTGSEAVEQAIKITKHIIGDKDIVSFTYNYHGSTITASSMNMIREEHLQLKSPMCCKGYCPYGKEKYNNCGKECFEKSLLNLKNPGAIIMSPYIGAYSTWFPKDYLLSLQKWIVDNKILVIDDEIQSGFFRTGKKCFGFQNTSIEIIPDIILGGKGVTSLLPLSILSINDRILDMVPIDDYFSTHSGNPVCLASMIAAIKYYLSKDIGNKVCNNGQLLSYKLQLLMNKHNSIVGLFGKGYAQSLLFENNYKGKRIVKKIITKMAENNVLLIDTERPIIKFCPPLVTTDKQINKMIKVLDSILEELKKE